MNSEVKTWLGRVVKRLTWASVGVGFVVGLVAAALLNGGGTKMAQFVASIPLYSVQFIFITALLVPIETGFKWLVTLAWFDHHGPGQENAKVRDRVMEKEGAKEKPGDALACAVQGLGLWVFRAAFIFTGFYHAN